MKFKDFSEKYSFLCLVAILFLAFLLRFHQLDKYGLAGDEKYSLLVSRFISQEGGNQGNTFFKKNSPYFTNQEFHSPKNLDDFQRAIAHRDNGSGAFYGILLHHWGNLFGVEDASLRFLSLLFNLLTIFLTFIFVKTHFKSSNLALLSAFLASISPFYVSYSQVVRNYSLLFLLALLASHILLLLLKNQKNIGLYFLYGIVAFATLMTHYSVFILFLIHGFYVLVFHRKIKLILYLALSMLIPALGLWWWLFNSEGGKWAFHSINFSADVYKEMAKNKPDEWLSVSTFQNVFKQLWLVFSHSFLVFEPFIQKLVGLKNVVFCLVLAIFNYLNFNYFKLKFSVKNFDDLLNKSVYFLIFGIIFNLAITFFFSLNRLYFLAFSFILPLIIIALSEKIKSKNEVDYFILFMVFLPFVFLMFFAFNDGTTMRMIPRYIGFGYAFGIILIAQVIKNLFKKNELIKIASWIVIIWFFPFLNNNLQKIYDDNPPRYFYGFSEPRIKNPYMISAEKIIETYSEGDTLIHPSKVFSPKNDGFDMPPYSVQDAQYLNIYLPQKPNIIQRVNPSEPNKIILKKANGKEIEIFDFQGEKYRY